MERSKELQDTKTTGLNSTMEGRKRRSHSYSSDSDSDPDFDYKEEDFSYSPTLPSKKSQRKKENPNPTRQRKKLTLPKVPKGQRSTGKNRNEEKRHASKTEIDVFDSEDEVVHSDKSKDFEMLVKAAFHNDEGQLTPLDGCPTKGLSITEEEQPGSMSVKREIMGSIATSEEKEKQGNPSSKRPFVVDKDEDTDKEEFGSEKEAAEYSLPKDEHDDDENEDSCADDSYGLGKPITNQKNNQSHPPVALEQNKMDSVVSYIKKAQSRLRHQWTSPVPENIEKKSTLPVSAAVSVKKSTELLTPEPPKSIKETAKFTATKSKASGESESDKSSNILRLQSSSVPHRRVLGLSRRVRPAPLHPYLSKTD